MTDDSHMPLRLVHSDDGPDAAPQAEGAPVLELICDGLDRDGAPLLDGLHLTLRPGQTVLVTAQGPGLRHGLMRCASGLEPGLRGRLRLPAGVGAVLPDPALPLGQTPMETVMMCAPVDPVAAFGVLSEAGLAARAEAPTQALCQTDMRRLWLACACAGSPGLLVLDGVFDGLSQDATSAVMASFAAMRAARRLGVLLSGEDTRPLLPVCNRVIRLGGQPGRILSEETARPAPLEVPRAPD